MIPARDKVWQFAVNRWLPSAATLAAPASGRADNAALWIAIKSALLGFAASPWQVDYSCDGVSAGAPGDGVDRWTSEGVLTYTTTAWIVLRQPGLGSGFRLLVVLGPGSTYSRVVVVFSPSAGFTGGTTTARPTAADEVISINATGGWHALANSDSNAFSAWLHVMQSTDGQCTRVLVAGVQNEAGGVTVGGFPGALILMDRVKDPVIGWTTPIVVGVIPGGATNHFLGSLFRRSAGGSTTDAQVAPLKGGHAGQTLNFGASMDGYGVGGLGVGIAERRAARNDITGEWVLCPMTIVSEIPGRQNVFGPGGRGRYGALYDLYYGSTQRLTGDTYPANGRELLHFGNVVLPWNGSYPRMVF